MKIGPHNIGAFIAAYEKAEDEVFVFEGHDVFVPWAKRVIEYFASINLPLGQQ